LHYPPYQDIATAEGRTDMARTHVSIGQVKRDISDLVNRVAYGGERIVLTSRGNPKAAIVSIEDYQRLEQEKSEQALALWEDWLGESEQLNAAILARRHDRPLDIDALWDAARADLEERDAQTTGGWRQLCLSLDPAGPPASPVSIGGDPMATERPRVGSAGSVTLRDNVGLVQGGTFQRAYI
jgi:prevent-host-death family protein